MSEEAEVNQEEQDELSTLKDRARLMGLSFHPNIGVDTLRERVNASMSGEEPEQDEPPAVAGKAATKAPVKLTKSQQRTMDRKHALRNARKLVRVHVTCMDPNMADYQGQFFSNGNALVPTIKRMVPFNVDTHVEAFLLPVIRDVKYTHHSDEKDSRGRKIQKQRLVNSYNVVELPSLTEQELQDLAQRQAMANGTADA